MCQNIGNDAVRYSRTGDVFHYRWVALKCLDMLSPLSNIDKIVVENSQEKMDGEYVIDVSEYLSTGDVSIKYYQMKHTVKEKEAPATISFLKNTLEGFAKRYIALRKEKKHKSVLFYVVTNRKINQNLKDNIYKKAKGIACLASFDKYIKEYTTLDKLRLRDFCNRLVLVDGSGDYEDLWFELYVKTCQLLVGQSGKTAVDKLEIMVRDKALPNSDGSIMRENVLKCLGYSSIDFLFPAPQMLEAATNIVERQVYNDLIKKIEKQSKTIIHAVGGVGKSIFAQYLKQNVYGEAVLYDCFGLGSYRNRSRIRHGFKVAFTQIVSELASMGLCDFMLVSTGATPDEIMRMFLQRINQACKCIQQRDREEKLYIVIDAADNAEMAAEEYKEQCFVHELLKEDLPDGCCLVMLCRTERVHLLEPSDEIAKGELLPFSENEVELYLEKNSIKGFNKQEVLEFFRLTGGNPRVIANAIALGKNKEKILEYLGPKGTSVNQQIEFQLKKALDRIKSILSEDYQQQINSICFGLSVLPPFIPISVLAQIADVDESTIKSFISDMGRTFWLTDDKVIQFRDEPVETWFRDNFTPEKEMLRIFTDRIKDQASKSLYAAEILPVLYLRAECLDEVVALAFNEEEIPAKDKFDSRNVKMLRYRYAFSGAIKAGKYKDTVKIAFLAAKETAGNQKLNELLKKNVDLVPFFSEKNAVQELAFSRSLKGQWQGSDNVYISSLLSGYPECEGEVRTYLRASERWMRLCLEEQKREDNRGFRPRIENDDISELGYAAYNYRGIECVAHFFGIWSPKRVTFEIVSSFISRLVDQGKFSDIDEFTSQVSDDVYCMMAVCNELDKIGKKVSRDNIVKCWDKGIQHLQNEKFEYDRGDRKILEGFISFIEQSSGSVDDSSIKDIIRKVLPVKAGYDFIREEYSETKSVFLRGYAIKKHLGFNLDEEDWMPNKEDEQTAMEIFNLLFPLYDIRLKLLLGIKNVEVISSCRKAKSNKWLEMRQHQGNLLNDIAIVHAKTIMVGSNLSDDIIRELLKEIQNIKLYVEDEIVFLRGVVRNKKLNFIWEEIEQGISERLNRVAQSKENINELPEWYFLMARTLLAGDVEEAHAYFNLGIESVGNFSEEIVSASKQMAEMCEKCAEVYHQESELASQFVEYMEEIYSVMHGDWDYKKAIQACIRMSPADSLAAISRFRDMDENWIEYFFENAAEELISIGYLSPTEGWALSAFMPDERVKHFSQKCSEQEEDPKKAMEIREAGERYYKMMVLSEKQDDLQMSYIGVENEADSIMVEEIFKDIDLWIQDGLKELLQRINRYRNSVVAEAACQNMYNKIERGRRLEFLDNLIKVSDLSLYNFLEVIKYIPETWLKQRSIQEKSNDYIYKICNRWCWELLDRFRRRQFVVDMPFDVTDNESAFKGFMDGIALVENFDSHSQYIEYISIALHYLIPDDAKELLYFALDMMREDGNSQNKKDKVGGTYKGNKYPNGKEQLAGFIYTSLGSPVAKTRWEGVHAVVRLAKMKCRETLQELINYDKDVAGIFIKKNYTHYKMHSILYLLIALYRVAKESVDIVIPYSEKIVYYASEFIDHALIQRIAVEIVKIIHEQRKDVFEKGEYEKLLSLITSGYPVVSGGQMLNDEEDEDRDKFYFGYDITRYWFGKLGEVFGVSEKYIEGQVAKIITEQWKIGYSGAYSEDSRKNMWEDVAYRERTYHSHGSYPAVDTYNFYLSYHGMMVVAAKLLKERPTVKGLHDEENPWEYWISRHLLSRDDGLLLSDMRGEIPQDIKEWYATDKNELWIQNIESEDFITQLMNGDKICISGYWKQKDGKYQEEIRINSALVAEESAEALVCTLMGYKDANDFKLPEYEDEEDDCECEIPPFTLKGYVKSDYPDTRLDRFDPWAANVSNSVIEIGDEYKKKICFEHRKIERWSFSYEEEGYINGERMSVPKSELKNLIKETGLFIILEVNIARDHTFQYNHGEYTYKSPKHKIYLFNGEDLIDGEI